MYKIIIDGHLVYSPYDQQLSVYDANVELLQNDISTFEMVLPKSNPYADSIIRMKSKVLVTEDGILLFSGVVCEDEVDLDGNKLIRCKNDLFYLDQTIIRPYRYGSYEEGTCITFNGNGDEVETTVLEATNVSAASFFEAIIAKHNAVSSHPFTIGTVNVQAQSVFENDNYDSTWAVISSLLEEVGGFIQLRYSNDASTIYIDWVENFSDTNLQTVEYAKNLLDFNSETSGLELATVLIPLGATIETSEIIEDEDGDEVEVVSSSKIDITSVNGGRDYIQDNDAVALYGHIEATHEWETITEPSELLLVAQDYLQDMIYHTRTITVKAVDLKYVDDYATPIRMHKYIRVVSEANGIDNSYLPTSMNIDLFEPENNTIELSSIITTSSGTSVTRGGTVGKSLVETDIKRSNDMVDNINANKARIREAQIDTVNVKNKLTASKADIDFANVATANITEAWIKDLMIQGRMLSNEGQFFQLVGVRVNGDLIIGNTIQADKLLLQGEDGLYYAINVNSLGETTASADEKYQHGIDGSILVAHSVTADKVTVADLMAFNATIGGFIIDETALRSYAKHAYNDGIQGVYLASGLHFNYDIYTDENGNVLTDENGNILFDTREKTNVSSEVEVGFETGSGEYFRFSNNGVEVSGKVIVGVPNVVGERYLMINNNALVLNHTKQSGTDTIFEIGCEYLQYTYDDHMRFERYTENVRQTVTYSLIDAIQYTTFNVRSYATVGDFEINHTFTKDVSETATGTNCNIVYDAQAETLVLTVDNAGWDTEFLAICGSINVMYCNDIQDAQICLFGEGLTAGKAYQTIFGQYNKFDQEANLLVSNGTSDHDRNNALEVYDNRMNINHERVVTYLNKTSYDYAGRVYYEYVQRGNQVICSGFVTDSKQQLRFSYVLPRPLDMEVLSSDPDDIEITRLKIAVRTADGQYLGTTSSKAVATGEDIVDSNGQLQCDDCFVTVQTDNIITIVLSADGEWATNTGTLTNNVPVSIRVFKFNMTINYQL